MRRCSSSGRVARACTASAVERSAQVEVGVALGFGEQLRSGNFELAAARRRRRARPRKAPHSQERCETSAHAGGRRSLDRPTPLPPALARSPAAYFLRKSRRGTGKSLLLRRPHTCLCVRTCRRAKGHGANLGSSQDTLMVLVTLVSAR